MDAAVANREKIRRVKSLRLVYRRGYGLPKYETVHINSVAYADKSLLFNKLFTLDMSESKHTVIDIHLHPNEKIPFSHLNSFMNTDILDITAPAELLHLLVIADRFLASSCAIDCIDHLIGMNLSVESAMMLCTQLPPFFHVDLTPLKKHAHNCLMKNLKDLMIQPELLQHFTATTLEEILRSDDLEVDNEDPVFHLAILWMDHHCDSQEARQLIMDQLQQYIRFPYMSFMQLKELPSCLDLKGASKIAEEALVCKLGQEHLPARRAYKFQPVKSLNVDSLGEHMEVQFDIKRDDCAALYPFGKLTFEPLDFGGRNFIIQAYCHGDEEGTICFGLYLRLSSQYPPQTNILTEFEYSVKRRPDMEFAVLAKNRAMITPTVGRGYHNIFQLPWVQFIADGCEFFADDIHHLQVKLAR